MAARETMAYEAWVRRKEGSNWCMNQVINHKDGDKAPPSSPPKPPTDAILPASATPMVKRSSKAALASAPQRKAKTAIS